MGIYKILGNNSAIKGSRKLKDPRRAKIGSDPGIRNV